MSRTAGTRYRRGGGLVEPPVRPEPELEEAFDRLVEEGSTRLARSELFTENFLVPVTAVAARHGSLPALIRLWLVSLVANLAGGWGIAWLVCQALPDLHDTAAESATHYAHLGVNLHS